MAEKWLLREGHAERMVRRCDYAFRSCATRQRERTVPRDGSVNLECVRCLICRDGNRLLLGIELSIAEAIQNHQIDNGTDMYPTEKQSSIHGLKRHNDF